MADDAAAITDEQLTQEDKTEMQAEQPPENVEDTETQDDTVASTSNEQNEGASSQNVEGQDEAAATDEDETKGANSLYFVSIDAWYTIYTELTSSEPAKSTFPRTLEEFGYKFNDSEYLILMAF